MFLRPLSNEQKELVLGLAQAAAEANGAVEGKEKALLDGFVNEMGISVASASSLNFGNICHRLVEISSRKELNQIAFEILGVMFGDTEYDNKEKSFMLALIDSFGISKEQLGKMEQCAEEYLSLYKKIVCLMHD